MKQILLVLLVLLLPSAMLLFFDWHKPDPALENRSGTAPMTVTSLDPPVTEGTGQPHLVSIDSGRVYLSWQQSNGPDETSLWVSSLLQDQWSAPHQVAHGSEWFVNWADFPDLAVNGDWMAASWLQRTAATPYAYDVRVALSRDGGAQWLSPVSPHSDGTPTEHGFVSMQPWADGFAIAWLDGRRTVDREEGAAGGAMTLRAAFMDSSGGIENDTLLDDRVCDCCQTAMVVAPDSLHVFYRDRSEDEVRDIAAVRFTAESGWENSRRVAADDWTIAGCPVNGPAAAQRDGVMVVSWFTETAQEARIQVAFSRIDETGSWSHFQPPFRIDRGDPIGRTDVLFLGDGSVLVSWLEFEGEGEGAAAIRVRRVTPEGRQSRAEVAAIAQSTRATGFPRTALSQRDVLLAWTDPEENRVRVIRLEDPTRTLPLVEGQLRAASSPHSAGIASSTELPSGSRK